MTDDIETRPDLNTGEAWSDIDLWDLANCVRLNDPIEEIAEFMCRSRQEIREKLTELESSGELNRWMGKAAAEVVVEPDDKADE